MNMMNRHSGAGRNPVDPMISCVAGQHGFVRYAGRIFLLDSGLRRNDAAVKHGEE